VCDLIRAPLLSCTHPLAVSPSTHCASGCPPATFCISAPTHNRLLPHPCKCPQLTSNHVPMLPHACPTRHANTCCRGCRVITSYRCSIHDQCSEVYPGNRTNCGMTLTEQECLADGCCYDDTVPFTFYCFNKSGTPPPPPPPIGMTCVPPDDAPLHVVHKLTNSQPNQRPHLSAATHIIKATEPRLQRWCWLAPKPRAVLRGDSCSRLRFAP
jgi:hypothetical protein